MNTTEQLRKILADWYTGKIGDATLFKAIEAEFVLIPRTEIPAVIIRDGTLLTDDNTKCAHFPANDDSWPAARHRAVAFARLALAEAVDARNADLKVIAAAELAADNDKLDAEAIELYAAAQGYEVESVPKPFAEKYRALALAARRIHGVTK